MFDLVLPWPPKELNPNARTHFKRLAAVKKTYREACAMTAKEQGAMKIDAKSVHVSFMFFPPDKRRRDLDNMLASCKALCDSLADVIGVDDYHWSLSLKRSDIVGGMVAVRIEAS